MRWLYTELLYAIIPSCKLTGSTKFQATFVVQQYLVYPSIELSVSYPPNHCMH